MITIKRLLATTRATFANPRALAIFAVLYALLLASLYAFVATREATIWQVAITLLFLVLAPAEFFILQSSILAHARGDNFHWRGILIDSCKLFVVTIPILIIGYVLFVLLNKWQVHFPAPRPPITFPPALLKAQPLHWPTLLFATAKFLLFGIVLPLATIHLWIEVAAPNLRTLVSDGAGGTLKRLGEVIARAFASQSVLTYALGLIVFALIPYALLFVHIPVKGTKTDFAIFIARLALVFVFTFFGWIVTIGALMRNATGAPEARLSGVPSAATALGC